MTELRYYVAGDERGVEFDAIDQLKDNSDVSNIWEALPRICGDNMYTIWQEGELLSILGWSMDDMSNANAFMIPSKMLPKRFNKEVLRAIREVMNRIRTKRIQTTCANIARNRRFLEFLGFKQECLMRKYGKNGEDIYLYAKVEE